MTGRRRAERRSSSRSSVQCRRDVVIDSPLGRLSCRAVADLRLRGLGFRLALASASAAARSARIRSSSTDAGSSSGSCGTSFPENACLRMLWRRRLARFRPASTAVSAFWMIDRWRSTSAIILYCSASGGRGSGINCTRVLFNAGWLFPDPMRRVASYLAPKVIEDVLRRQTRL